MKSIFDIISTVMIGPSSSHTAGGPKLASLVRVITAGFLGFSADDERIPDAVNITANMGVKINFVSSNILH